MSFPPLEKSCNVTPKSSHLISTILVMLISLLADGYTHLWSSLGLWNSVLRAMFCKCLSPTLNSSSVVTACRVNPNSWAITAGLPSLAPQQGRFPHRPLMCQTLLAPAALSVLSLSPESPPTHHPCLEPTQAPLRLCLNSHSAVQGGPRTKDSTCCAPMVLCFYIYCSSLILSICLHIHLLLPCFWLQKHRKQALLNSVPLATVPGEALKYSLNEWIML